MKRAEIKAIFPEATKDQMDNIMDLHGEGLETIKTNYKDYVPKSQLDTITAELTALKNAQKTEPLLTETDVADLKRLRTFETDTLTAKTTESKTAALTKSLEAAKANPKAIKLLLKEFVLDNVELDDTGAVKGFDELVKPVKENYSDFFGVEVLTGAQAGKAPAGTPGKADPFLAGFNDDQFKK